MISPRGSNNTLCVLAALAVGCGGGLAGLAPARSLGQAKQATAPLHAESEADLRDALVAASASVPALVRLIDPAWGVGTFDPADSGAVHHCALEDFTTHPGMAFSVQPEDRFACDRARRRCTVASRDGGGYAFFFRESASGATTLDAVVHYRGRTLPTRDARAVLEFVEGGDGVCALRRALAPDTAAPARFSAFVAHQTGLAPVAAHACGDEARALFGAHAAPHLGAAAPACTRAPARCSMRLRDEDVTFYGGERGASAVTITRHGMHASLERAQERDRAGFLRAAAAHSCPP
ncbi:MAG: hypothetical protein KF729_15980 [Sandaracinaceae bacterium]|nr:hypothetical protein [Sandaracinaceae bacterium]